MESQSHIRIDSNREAIVTWKSDHADVVTLELSLLGGGVRVSLPFQEEHLRQLSGAIAEALGRLESG